MRCYSPIIVAGMCTNVSHVNWCAFMGCGMIACQCRGPTGLLLSKHVVQEEEEEEEEEEMYSAQTQIQ